MLRVFPLLVVCSLAVIFAQAQDVPYFVTYNHDLTEPGNLEISVASTIGPHQAGQHSYIAPYLELEYGATRWWTPSFYLEGQSTAGQATFLTGWRVENRFRVLPEEHRINPLFYLEYENINEASRIQKEIVGLANSSGESTSDLRGSRARELEAKLIFSSDAHRWNISENFTVEKNVISGEDFEFGYALGVFRALAKAGVVQICHFCRQNFSAGLEVYGGLGTAARFGLRDTAQYLAPAASWQITANSALHFSPAAGLTRGSQPLLLRLGYSYEIRGFNHKVANFFGHNR
jgi:hypothetical protein